MKKTTIWMVLVFLSLFASAEKETVCMVYFTGVGCPHCAKTDPIVLGELPTQYNGSFIVIEYEIYQHPENARIMAKYVENYGIGYGVPQMVIGREDAIVGDKPILRHIDDMIKGLNGRGNPCPIITGEKMFSELDLNSIPGKPQIWARNRVLVKNTGQPADDKLLKELVTCEQLDGRLTFVEAFDIPLSGGKIEFNKAAAVGGWTLLWNDDDCETGDAHEVTDRWIWHYLENAYLIVIFLGVAVVAAMTLHDKKREVKEK